jgi:hypothetical protein
LNGVLRTQHLTGNLWTKASSASQDVDYIYDQAVDKEKDSLKTGTPLEAIKIGQRKLGIRPSRSGVGGNLELSSESH